MHARGSGFFDFSYTTLTTGNLLVALLFFANPSRGMRVLTYVIAFFLLVDMIVILAVGRLRQEEGSLRSSTKNQTHANSDDRMGRHRVRRLGYRNCPLLRRDR